MLAQSRPYLYSEYETVFASFQRNTPWIIEKAREFQKNIDFCFIDYFKAFDCEDPNGLWKIVKETGISDQLTHFLQKQIKKQQLEPDMEQ